MAEVHLDHPGDIHWFHGYAPAPVIGPCPHTACKHFGQSVIAWGPDYEHYELVKCDDTEGCNGTCRSWWSDHPPGENQPTRGNGQWLHVTVSADNDCDLPSSPVSREEHPVSNEEFIYPAPSWRTGDAVIVDSEGNLWDGCVGVVAGEDDRSDDTWLVQFDGMLASFYGYALRVPTAEEASGD